MKPYPSGEIDHTTAMPLEIDEQTAIAADDRLREFAQEADLEISLIVDRSGALVAGIASDANLPVDVISALVAGANGAMRALNSQVGGNGALESLHFGGDRLIYLREVAERFVLVAVAESTHPAGLIREKAVSLDPVLCELLAKVAPKALLTPEITMKSTRNPTKTQTLKPEIHVASESFSEKVDPIPQPVGTSVTSEVAIEEPDFPGTESSHAESEVIPETQVEVPTLPEVTAPEEPKEILEPLDFDEPEIIVETTFLPIGNGHVIDLPFPSDPHFEVSPPPVAVPPILDEVEPLITAHPDLSSPEPHSSTPKVTPPPDPVLPPSISTPTDIASVASESLLSENVISEPISSADELFQEAGVFEIAEEDYEEEREEEVESPSPATDAVVAGSPSAEIRDSATGLLPGSPQLASPPSDFTSQPPLSLPVAEEPLQEPSPTIALSIPSPPPLPPQFEIELDEENESSNTLDSDEPEFPARPSNEEPLIIVTEEDLRSGERERTREVLHEPEAKPTPNSESEPEIRISGPFYF